MDKEYLIEELSATISRIEEGKAYTSVHFSQQLLIDEVQNLINRAEDGEIWDDGDIPTVEAVINGIIDEITVPEEIADEEGDD